ncbi:MAG TPA: hypothetical protein VIL42_11100 [Sphingomicrobium sp.]|jgi:hypothetical protein
MQEYRLYVLDGSGTLQFPREIVAPDDHEAIALADAECGEGHQMELWHAKRKVHCWGFAACPSKCERPAAH